MLGNVKDICSEDQSNGFTCPNGRTTFSSSVIWGAIGPGRVYSIGKIYSGLLHFFWIGALMPIITWVIWKYWRKDTGEERSWIRLINWPLIFVGTYNVPPATGINYSSWALVNLTFNWWIKAKWFAWWCKYDSIDSRKSILTDQSQVQLRFSSCSRYRPRTISNCDILLYHISWSSISGLVGYVKFFLLRFACKKNNQLTLGSQAIQFISTRQTGMVFHGFHYLKAVDLGQLMEHGIDDNKF